MTRLAGGVVWVFAGLLAAALLAAAPAAAQSGAQLFAQAEQALSAGDAAKAVDLYSSAIRSGSLEKGQLARAFLSRGRAQQFTGQHARGVADFTNALWLEALERGDQARAYGWRAVSRQALGQAGLANEDLTQARNLDAGFDPGAGSSSIASAPAAAPVGQVAASGRTAGPRQDAGSDGNFFSRIFSSDDAPDATVTPEAAAAPQPAARRVASAPDGGSAERPGLLTRLLGDDETAQAQQAPGPVVQTDPGAPRSLLPADQPSQTVSGDAAPPPRPSPRLAGAEPVPSPARPAGTERPDLLSTILGRPQPSPAPEAGPPPLPRQAAVQPAVARPVAPPPQVAASGPAIDEGSAWTTTANQGAPIIRAAAPGPGQLGPGGPNDLRASPVRRVQQQQVAAPPPPPPPPPTPAVTASRTGELESGRPPRQSIFSRLFGSSQETSPQPLRPPAPSGQVGAQPVQQQTGGWDTNVVEGGAEVQPSGAAPAPTRVASLDWGSATQVRRAAPPPRPARAAAPAPERRASPPPPARRAAVAPPQRTQSASPAPVRRIPQPGPEAAVRTSDDGYAVQVAARRSLDDAKREASEVTRRYSALFGGTRPYIVKADVPGKGTYYRVRFGPFAERTQVAGLCQQLKGQGQDCFPVQP